MKIQTPTVIGLAISLAFWPHLHSAALAPRWAACAIAAPILALQADRLQPKVLLWLIWPALGLAWSTAPLQGAGDLIHLVILALVFMVGRGLAEAPLEDFMSGMAYGVAFQLPLAAAQIAGFTWVEQLSAAPAGLFLNRDLLGEAAAPLALWAVICRRHWLGAALLALVVLSQSRIAIGLTGLGLVLTGPSIWRLMGAIICVTGIGLLLDSAREASALQRLQIWQASAAGASLLGSGLGSFAARHPYWEYSHSDFLQIAYELGWPAALAFAVWTALALRSGGPFAAPCAILFAEGLVDFPLHLPASGFLAAALLGHLVRRNYMLQLLEPQRRTSDFIPVQQNPFERRDPKSPSRFPPPLSVR